MARTEISEQELKDVFGVTGKQLSQLHQEALAKEMAKIIQEGIMLLSLGNEEVSEARIKMGIKFLVKFLDVARETWGFEVRKGQELSYRESLNKLVDDFYHVYSERRRYVAEAEISIGELVDDAIGRSKTQ